MMNPSVGLTLLTSSPMIFLTIVVLPALSSPLRVKISVLYVFPWWFQYSIRIRISLSFSLAFRKIESILLVWCGGVEQQSRRKRSGLLFIKYTITCQPPHTKILKDICYPWGRMTLLSVPSKDLHDDRGSSKCGMSESRDGSFIPSRLL
jgi:hypothetical protein